MLHISSADTVPAWDNVYDKYSPIMFGMICKFTDNSVLAEKILSDAFLKLREQELLSTLSFKRSPLITILRHTYQCSVQFLHKKGVSIELCDTVHQMGILWLVCTQCPDLKSLSARLGMSEADARKKLFTEFSTLAMLRPAIPAAA